MQSAKEALTRIQVLIIALVVIIAAIGGAAYYFLTLPKQTQKIKFGAFGPLTGPSALQGKYLKQGFMLAAKDLNAKGGILGKEVEVVFVDDKTDPDTAVSEIERLITIEGIKFLGGGTSSTTHLPTMDVVAKYDALILYSTPASTAMCGRVRSNPDKYKNIFFLDLNSTIWGSFEVLWLDQAVKTGQWTPKNMKVALVAEDTDWGREVCNTWNITIREKGWEVVDYEVVDYGQVDFYSLLAKIKAYDPAVIKAELTAVQSGVAMAKQLKELGINALFFPGYSAEVKEFEELAGSAADYAIYYGYPVPKSWVDHLLEEFPDSDPTGAFWGYDTLMVLADAIEKAGSFEIDKVREAMLKYPHEGVWGTYVFISETHRPIYGPDYITPGAVEFYQGKRYFIWPPKLKDKEYNLPYHDFIPPPT